VCVYASACACACVPFASPNPYLDLVLGLDQVLAVQVAVRTHCLVQILLLLELGFPLSDPLLQAQPDRVLPTSSLQACVQADPSCRQAADVSGVGLARTLHL